MTIGSVAVWERAAPPLGTTEETVARAEGTVRLCESEKDFLLWDRFLFDFPGAHYFQTYGWLNSYVPMGLTPRVLVYEENGAIEGGVAFLSAKMPLLPWKLFIIPHGPLPASPDAPGWLPLMTRLDQICREEKAIYAQIYPHELSEESELVPCLEDLGFTAPPIFTSHRFSSTPVTVGLAEKSEDDILKSLRPNTRTHVRRALTSGLTLRTNVDQKVFDEVYELFQENGGVMGYQPRPRASLEMAWDWFAPKGWATLFQAWYGDTLAGAILVLFTGRTAYYLAGATRREFAKYYPAEFMHWCAIRNALERNLETYDLVNPVSKGVRQFKEGFRPEFAAWHQPRTKLYRPLLAKVLRSTEPHLRPMIRTLVRMKTQRTDSPNK
jgi:lipid II:glycine glycyltransferase (peptidoglycan interpeptide bridge formation enzyme)